jgi:hypothetical protein
MDCRVKPGNDEREGGGVACIISERTSALCFWGLPSPTETR